ncbi:MAG: CotH kinase family protein [Bacteroidales bacterium]|nr:CotH kinase family protein [Bacteroidales bacterium]
MSLIAGFSLTVCAQTTDHWETVVSAGDTWSWFPGYSQPASGWNTQGFDDSSWLTGPGGIGYGDGDDMTVTDKLPSVYMRREFTLYDISAISAFCLFVDFDDGFVAYLNGHEIARANIGTIGTEPGFSEYAILDSYEARLPSGGIPSRFVIDLQNVAEFLVEGDNLLALQVHNCNEGSSDLSSTTFLIAGIIDDSRNYWEPPAWFRDPATEYSYLPLIVLETEGGEIVNDPKITSRMKVVDNGPGELNNQYQEGTDYDGFIGIEIRGQSSQMFPKKSYSLELRTLDGADTSASLLDMPAEEDWVLYAPYSDKTMLRNALTFHLGARMGGWQPENRFCEVWLNGDYMGVYQLMESIKRDDNRVDISKLNPDEISGDDLTGGYIVKADKLTGIGPEEYFQITPSVRYNYSEQYRFTYVYPKYDQIANEQKYYIRKYLTDAENTLNGESFRDLSEGFRKYFDTKSFIDFQIIQELANNVDGYRYSTFFYKDKDSKGGKLKAGPLWDFDLCYGNVDYADLNLATDVWLYRMYGGRIHWWARMMEDLGYRASFAARWKDLRKGPFSTDSIMKYVDNTIVGLGDAIDRNFERWPVLGKYVWPNYFVGETYEEEISFFKDWITRRVSWIDANIMVAETASSGLVGDILVFPNPVRDRIGLYFHLKNPGRIRIVLTDLMGHRIIDDELIRESEGDQYIEFSLDKQVPGFYVLQLFQNGSVIGRESVIIAR